MRFLFPRSLNTKLILSHLIVALVGILLISIYAGRSLIDATLNEVKHGYDTLAFAAASNLRQPLADFDTGRGTLEPVQRAAEDFLQDYSDLVYTVYSPEGQPLISSSASLPAEADPESNPEIWQALKSRLGDGAQVRQDGQTAQKYFLAVRIGRQDHVYGVLHLEAPLASAFSDARRSLWLLFLTDVLVILWVSLVGYLFARSLSRPLEDLTQTAERISTGDLQARVDVPEVAQEIQRLANAFNFMADRLQANLNELRGFVANASHELRTPLTSVKLRVEALRSGALDDPPVAERFLSEIESEVDRLSRIVDDLLDLSRIEAGLASSVRTPLDMTAMTREVCDTFKTRAEKTGIVLCVDADPDLPVVHGNEDQLRRVLYNLVDNAIKYTTRGGKVDVMLKRSEAGDRLRLLVKDNGFGIDAQHLPHIFERFYRVEATRPRYGPPQGSGLGLSIARSIVETHGGRISVASRPGEGTTFTVELPAIP